MDRSETYLLAQTLLHKLGDLSHIQIEGNKSTLAALPEQHIGLHHQSRRRQPCLLVRQFGEVRRLRHLRRVDLQVDSGDSFQVLFQQSLRIVLSDLLPSHLVRPITPTESGRVRSSLVWWWCGNQSRLGMTMQLTGAGNHIAYYVWIRRWPTRA